MGELTEDNEDRPAFSDHARPLVGRRAELAEDLPGVRSRILNAASPGGWTGPVVSEWELRAAGWEDCHPHTELNVVLEGRLYVESGGVEVVVEAGDWVEVPAGVTGRYWAPDHARMLSVYGPNPDGLPTPPGRGWRLPGGG